MTLLWVVVAWAGAGRAPQIQLCGAYRQKEGAEHHIAEAKVHNPHLTFDIRICPFPTLQEETPLNNHDLAYFCPHCGKAFGAQLLREEETTAC